MGWLQQSIVVTLALGSMSACQRMEAEALDDGIPDVDSTTVDPFEVPEVPALEPCWRWDSPIATALFAVTATTDGDLVVVGANPTAVIRLSPGGEERWTLRPQQVRISNAVALPDGAFAVIGSWSLGSLAFARGYDADGDLVWEARPPEGIAYTAGWWWAEREQLVVVGTDFGDSILHAYDADGEFAESFSNGAGYGEYGPMLQAITGFGPGFLVGGGVLGEPGSSHAAAYDGDGTYLWHLGHDGDGIFHDDVASTDGTWAILASRGLQVSRIDTEGDTVWTWSGAAGGEPSLAVAHDGRAYVSVSGREPYTLFGLSPDGAVESLVEVEDSMPAQADVAWANGRVYVAVLEQPSHVDCWIPPD